MREGGTILALDLATAFGWAEGSPGSRPFAGSGRFSTAGSGHAAIGADALVWFADRLALEKPSAVFVERPGLHSVASGKSTFDVIYRLLGLCFLFEAVAYRRGVYRVEFAKAEDVRLHFLGTKSVKGAQGKKLVQRRCDELGWSWKNPDEADALALWDYGVEKLNPGRGHKAIPGLFRSEIEPIQRKPKAKLPDRISAKDARDLFAKKGRT